MTTITASGPFEVTIMSGSRPKYPFQDPTKPAHNQPTERKRYIEAKTSEKFAIKANLGDNVFWPVDADFVLIKFRMDNIEDPWYDVIEPQHLGPTGLDLSKTTWLCRQVPLQNPKTKQWTLQAPEFGRLIPATNKRALKKQLTAADLQKLGSIEVEMCFAKRRIRDKPEPYHGNIPENAEVIPEEVLQKLSLSHIVKWRKGEVACRPPPQNYEAIPLDGPDGEVHKFHFLYRTRDELKLLGYIGQIEQPKRKRNTQLVRPDYKQPPPPISNPTLALDEPDSRGGREMSKVQSVISRAQSQVSRNPSTAPRRPTATPRPPSSAFRQSSIKLKSIETEARPSSAPILAHESLEALSNYVHGPQEQFSTRLVNNIFPTPEARAGAMRGRENESGLFVTPWPQSPKAGLGPDDNPEDPNDNDDNDNEDDEPFCAFQFPPKPPTPPPPPPRPPKRPKIEPTRNLKRQRISEIVDDDDNSSRRSGSSTAPGSRRPTPGIIPSIEQQSERRSVRAPTIDLTGTAPKIIYGIQPGEVVDLLDDDDEEEQEENEDWRGPL